MFVPGVVMGSKAERGNGMNEESGDERGVV